VGERESELIARLNLMTSSDNPDIFKESRVNGEKCSVIRKCWTGSSPPGDT